MNLSIDQRAALVKCIVFDVDGVLTDGKVHIGSAGEFKSFNIQDGQGIVVARKMGIKIAFLTGRVSEATQVRARELKIDELYECRTASKGVALREVMTKLKVKPAETAYLGDDLGDLPAMRQVIFPVAVANAVEEVKFHAAWTTTRRGGDGAARELIEAILKAQERWAYAVQKYLEDE
jgi:YrbI family 3-deoxy-D-manno-octulosonate 8-phosphate phosphatase